MHLLLDHWLRAYNPQVSQTRLTFRLANTFCTPSLRHMLETQCWKRPNTTPSPPHLPPPDCSLTWTRTSKQGSESTSVHCLCSPCPAPTGPGDDPRPTCSQTSAHPSRTSEKPCPIGRGLGRAGWRYRKASRGPSMWRSFRAEDVIKRNCQMRFLKREKMEEWL